MKHFSFLGIESHDYLTLKSNLDFLILFIVLCLIVVPIFLIITTVLVGRKRGADQPPAQLTETDFMNQHAATARGNPDKYPLTKKLTSQYSHNVIKQISTPYESFPVNNSDCHMNDLDLVKMAAI